MNKYKRLGFNTLLVFIGNAGSKLIGLLMLPFYTRWLSAEDFGTYNLIFIYSSFLVGLVTLSIAESIFIFPKSVSKPEQKEYFTGGVVFFVMAYSLTGVIFYFIRSILTGYGLDNSITQYTWIIYVFIGLFFIQAYLQQFTRSIDKIKIYSASGLVLTISIACYAFLLIPSFGLKGYIMSQVAAYLTAILFTLFTSKAYKYFSISYFAKSKLMQMLKYSVPLMPNGVMWWLISSLNRPVLENYLGKGAVGIFAVANTFPSLMTTLFTVFSISWQISVLEEFGKDDFKSFYNRVLKVVFAVLTLISCGLALSSNLIIELMVDEKFYEAWKYIPLLTFAVLFSSLSSFVGMNFSASRESKYYFYSSIWGALVSVIFVIVLVPTFGIWGASITVVLAHFSMAISRIIYSWKYVQISSKGSYVGMILINVFIIITVLMIENVYAKMGLVLLLAMGFIYINWSLKDDLMLLLNIVRKKKRNNV